MASQHNCLRECRDIARIVTREWPLAFAETAPGCGECVYKLALVPLNQHNERVAQHALGVQTFVRMAAALEKRITYATTAILLSAALHDIGKSAHHYLHYSLREGSLCPPPSGTCGNKNKECKLGFNCHEHVAGVLLHQASLLLHRKGCKHRASVMWLAMQAIARHHSASASRHPKGLYEEVHQGGRGRGCLNTIVRALPTLVEGHLVSSLPRFLHEGWVADSLLEALDELSKEDPRGSLWEVVGKYAQSVQPDENRARDLSIPLPILLRFINVASGILIISDILISSQEGRHVEEQSLSAYAIRWMTELKLKQGNLPRKDEEDLHELVEGVVC